MVPVAAPAAPVETLHLTTETPALSLAVPLNTMLGPVAEMIVEPGD